MSVENKRTRSRSPLTEDKRFYGGKAGRDTNSNDSNSLRRRLFIGNLATDKTTKAELEELFGKFGELESCSLHNNFGFVQYINAKDADAAVSEMHGTTLFGKRIDVNLAGARRKTQNKDKFEGLPPKEEVVPENMRDFGRRPRTRSRSPFREGPPGGGYGRPLSPMSRYEQLYRKEGRPRDTYGPPPDGPRDYYPDHRDGPYPPRYERDYPPPPREDPYWREGYEGYRPPPPRAVRRPAIDCEIVALSKEESQYADEVESRLRSIGLVCNIGYPAAELAVLEVIDRIAQAGTLYAVVVSAQNAQHRSCTLNVLHGTRQEHRNMPLDNALSFVARNFDAYLKAFRDPYHGAPSQSAYASASAYPPRDAPRGYPPAPSAGYRPPVDSRLTRAGNSEKQMSNDELTQMIEKLKREKEERDAGIVKHGNNQGVDATNGTSTSASSYYDNMQYPPQQAYR